MAEKASAGLSGDNDTAMTGTENPDIPGDFPMADEEDEHYDAEAAEAENEDDDGNNEDEDIDQDDEDEDDEDDDDDPFGGFGDGGLSSTLRALTGMMSGLSSRLRDLLNSLRQDDPSVQIMALQELSEILLVSNEDNLSGTFSPDAFVKELVALMNKEDSPEIMLLACRCLANLMEALPASIANVVYRNAVPVLCSKLLEISFIDLAEQALSTLEKISVEYPSSIVREGGLTACLSFLDFFATSTQRTAVTTAANCCRNIPDDSFTVVRDVMPILLNVLSSNDQRVVEQASLCVCGIVESFKHQSSKLEELISVDLLRTVLRLLLPGTTNLIGSGIHTQFLRVLAFAARASPRLSAELFKLNVVETLYQILTGVSPPSGLDDVASKLDSVVVMQALIHRPREQIVETLNVVCELLPGLPKNANFSYGEVVHVHLPNMSSISTGKGLQKLNEERLKLLQGCQDEVRRFALILFPTLTDAFSSTVNLSVRQKVLTAQLRMLSNFDESILGEALTPVPYASFLASILSQQDHPSLVMLGLQATELLLARLDKIYRYQLYREGVIQEIDKLAKSEPSHTDKDDAKSKSKNTSSNGQAQTTSSFDVLQEDNGEDNGEDNDDAMDEVHTVDDEDEDEREDDQDDEIAETHEGDDDFDHGDEDHGDQDEEEDEEVHPADLSKDGSGDSTVSVDAPADTYTSGLRSMDDRIRDVAQKFMDAREQEGRGHDMKVKAQAIMDSLTTLGQDLEAFYLKQSASSQNGQTGKALFEKLASQFDAEALESITSAELLSSGLVQVLLNVFSNPDEVLARSAQATFLEVFMSQSLKSKPKTATADSPATPFSMMVHKLQDLLSRSEHFEVLTVHQNAFDGNRSSPASMLGKQIRLRLVADEDSNIPRGYRNIMVSIHAIATFKSLDDYLRPRISLSERPRAVRRDGLSRALAAMASATGMSLAGSPFAPGALPGPPPPLSRETPPSSSRPTRSRNRLLQHATAAASSDPSRTDPAPSSELDGGDKPAPSRDPEEAPSTPAHLLAGRASGVDSPLECADEKQVTDGEEDAADSSALDAIVGELDEDVDEEAGPDPSAVNVEVATGGNVTARKEDGSKIGTPGSAPASSQGPSTPTPHDAPTRSLSYASALQAVPQDWHIEFSVDGKAIQNETTIYRAIFMSATNSDEQHIGRSIWSSTHSIKFRRVPGPPPSGSGNNAVAAETSDSEIAACLAKNPATASILSLLNILHDMNANIEDVLPETSQQQLIGLNIEPLSQFVNTKLTAKLNRQLEEPLIVASSCLPSWSEDLARLYPFLFPFETRHLFLQSTSFGYARSMARWQNAQVEDNRRDRLNDRPFLGRLQRQKVRISRSKILESALKVLDLYGASQSILEVEYFEEVGTGLGPTLEFYSTVSKEFAKKKLRLWRDDGTGSGEFVTGQTGLFPRPLNSEELGAPNGERILHLFKILGKFVARSMIDSRIIDIHLNSTFFRIGDTLASGVRPSLGAVKAVDPGLARSLKIIKKFSSSKKEIDEDPNRTAAQKVTDTERIRFDNMTLDDLCLDFTLPGYPGIELEEGGMHKRVTMENVDDYLEKVIDMTLGSGVRQQVEAFRAGFSQVFPYTALSAFTPDELVALFGKVDEDWSLESKFRFRLLSFGISECVG